MAGKYKRSPKPRDARSPGTLQNMQHHDTSLSERDIAGSPGTVKEIVADSTVLTPLPKQAVIRVVNTSGATVFVFIGAKGDAPGGAPTIATGIAIPPNFYENFYTGELSSEESIHVKSSSTALQIVIFE